jgi:hypothetical protein
MALPSGCSTQAPLHCKLCVAGCGIGVGIGQKLWLSCGGTPGVERWTSAGQGKEKQVPTAILVCWALGYNVAESLMQAFLRPHIEVYLGLAPPFQTVEDDDAPDAEPQS